MSTDTTDEAPGNPFNTSKVKRSVLVLGVVLVGALVFIIYNAFQATQLPDANTPACERPASTDTSLTGAVPVDEWHELGASQLPVTVFGPSTLEGPVPSCFEQSPAGAAITAAQVLTLASNGNTTLVLEEMAVDSQNTDRFLAMTTTETVPTDPVEPVAVRVNDYTGDEATVTVVGTTEAGYRAMDFRLVWQDGDWKWQTPSESLSADVVPSIVGYNRLAEQGASADG